MSTTNENNANSTLFASAVALADCTFGNQTTSMSDVSVPVAHSADIPTKLNEVNREVDIIGKGVTIDVTDGKWHDVILYKGRYVGNDSPNVQFYTDNPGLVPVNVFLGIPHKEDKYVDPFDVTYSGDMSIHYQFHRINHIKFTCRNFCVVVERDTSGGVQIMDDLIFEVRRIYHYTPGETVTGIPQSSITSTLADLNKGLSIDIPLFNVGWLHRDDMYYQKNITQNAKSEIYVAYYLLAHLVDQGNSMNSLMLPKTPFYGYQIRCLNLPAGLTNIKVNLGYITEVKSQVSHLGRIYKTKVPFLQYPGELYNEIKVQALEDGTDVTESSNDKKLKKVHDSAMEQAKRRRR